MTPITPPNINIRSLSPRAVASTATHFEAPLMHRIEEAEAPAPSDRGLPLPEPARVMKEIGIGILHCKDRGDLHKAVWLNMTGFHWAKLQLLGDVFRDIQTKPGEFHGLARLATGEMHDLLNDAPKRLLHNDARLAAIMGNETLETCNAGFISVFPGDPGRFIAKPDFERYAMGVLAIEMVQLALALYLTGQEKPRTRGFPVRLAYDLQSWSEELCHLAKKLGFMVTPPVDFGKLPPPDIEALDMAEAAWFEASAKLR